MRFPRRTAGFSLVEIMVGMVIGMFGIMIMLQVFSLAEGQKRATASGGDAQTSGAIALFGVQRDIRQAGLGIRDAKLAACSVLLRAGLTLNVLAPVTINHASIPAGDANTDTILVVYGNANGSPEGDGITTQLGAIQNYGVQTPSSYTNGDQVIAAPRTRASPCNLVLDSVVNAAPPVGTCSACVIVSTGVASMTNGTLFNLGQAPKIYAYAIRSGNLTQCDFIANDCSAAGSTGSSTVWVPIANNIVSLRALYGRDTAAGTMDGVVDVYDQTAMTTACTVARVGAIKLALVARSANFEKTSVTPSTTDPTYPTWEGNATAAINITGLTSWQNYRYRVFQSTVPIRNIAWQGVVSGC
jgi:type IV pilus assembly protein PilW